MNRSGDTQRHEPIGEALSRLANDLGHLFRAELRLFRREATDQVRGLGTVAALAGGGLVAGLLCLGAFTALLIVALAQAMPWWAAALIVTLLYGAVTAVLGAAAAHKYHELTPIGFDRTTRSVKEDVAWIKSDLSTPK